MELKDHTKIKKLDLSPYISHSILKAETSLAEVEKVCKETLQHDFKSVCIPPVYVKKAKEFLANSNTKISTVIGFPFGYSAIEAKLAEIVLAIIDGVDELEITANISAIKNNDYTFIANELSTILPIVKNKNKVFKVIIESGSLTNDELKKCCDIYGAAGIDYLKTSTGFGEKNTSLNTIHFIRKYLADAVKIEAGYNKITHGFATSLIKEGVDRICCSNSVELIGN